MPPVSRTYALIGHGGSGKTTVAEMLLFASGAISRQGSIEEGTTALDYEPEEIKRRGSIQPGFFRFGRGQATHNIIDAPGDNNFIGDLGYTVAAADAAVLVVDAPDGVKPLTRKIFKEAQSRNLPSMAVVTKVDRDRADFDAAFASLSQLGVRPVLLYLPLGQREDFAGFIDVLAGTAHTFDGKDAPIPEDLRDEAQTLRETMVENIAESDEELMELYLEEGELSPQDIQRGLAQGVKSGELLPVIPCSGLNGQGGQLILDAIEACFPGPEERAPWQDADGNQRPASAAEPMAAFVCKTLSDPFSGQLTVLRVLSGTLKSDTPVQNAANDAKERVGQLLEPRGKEQTPLKGEAGPGSIVAVAKLKDTHTGDTLCEETAPFALAKPELPPTLITYALAAAEKGEEDKVYQAVHKLLDEDITLRLSRDEESGDILLSGMGQMHIETSVEKAKRRSKADIVLKTPKVPYRETLVGSADVQGRHKKQSGGRGQFGDCHIRINPLPQGQGYQFKDSIVGGAIPKQYIPAVDKGIQESARKGPLTGSPVVDFAVDLYDGSYHTVDSSEMAFKVAGSLAFKKACETAGLKLLEPVMRMSVFVPDEFMGDVIGDLSSRRGKVLGSDSQAGMTEIQAHVPMAEVLRYAPDLRSMTGGQGTFTMGFDHYEECPPQIAEKVVAAAKNQEG